MKKIMPLLFLVVFARTASATCYDPTMFGAAPNDGMDDGPAIRSAMSVGDVCLSSGEWDLGYVYGTGSVIVGSGHTLSGAGSSTVLKMIGDANYGTWFGVRVQGGTLQDMTITQDIFNPDPAGQNHLVRIDESSGSRLHGLAMGNMSDGGGDCIQLLGNTADITDLLISDVVAFDCERSGIAVQHGVRSASISGMVINTRIGSPIDYEPSSVGPTTINWSNITIIHTNTARALTMSDTNGLNNSVFSGMLIVNGNVQAVRATGVSFVGNVVIGSTTSTTPTFEIVRNSENMRVVGNLFIRPAGTVNSVVRFVCNNGSCPSRFVIADNVIEQNNLHYGIELDGVTMAAVRGNMIKTAWTYAIKLSASIQSPDLNIFSNNIITSTATPINNAGAIYLAASANYPILKTLILGNIGSGFTNAVLCANTITGPVRVDDNILGNIYACGTGVSVGWN